MKRILLSILVIGILLLSACGVPKEEYDKIERDLAAAQTESGRVTSELAQKNAEVNQLEREYNKVENDLQATASELAQTESELASLKNQYNDLQSSYDELYDEYLELLAGYSSTLDEYISALEELGQSLQVPYTAISGRQITSAWRDMDGDLHKWTWPMDAYRSWIELPEPNKTVSLKNGDTTYTIGDFRPYVRSEFFSEVVSSLYQESADEMVFTREAFNLVTQLTVYSKEIGEVPRWPVETLTEAGGDCEDLAILFASLLKAAPYPYELSFVYMDIDNPTDPQDINHVIVWVETDDWKLFVEVTSDQGWDYYESVVGWYHKL